MTSPALRIIGTIRTAYTPTEDTPVQAALNPHAEGVVEFDPPAGPVRGGWFDGVAVTTAVTPASLRGGRDAGPPSGHDV